jgi:hypothetical protein
MRGSAVSQCSLRFKHKVLEDKKLKKAMAEIGRKTGLVVTPCSLNVDYKAYMTEHQAVTEGDERKE